MGERNPNAVLPPDEPTWHLVAHPLAPRTLCGKAIGYGARLRAWVETPAQDRCLICLGLEGGGAG
jgi:hypothetical protein